MLSHSIPNFSKEMLKDICGVLRVEVIKQSQLFAINFCSSALSSCFKGSQSLLQQLGSFREELMVCRGAGCGTRPLRDGS